ncbi:30S ribosomal protein S12 methylthiotransferase RimO [Neomoorella mulderi]|uniref:Ribosomal protein uS12 methylthiotransferase RimO n=1 Tax=Moorella mulderi DSM 14980 TaxID=1122241 RepID=A0A151ATU2_9FIRM|nr:30S ribosomal protein S12 methylthiotransferase RimO [Moorella mulderi]KYH31074.1 ribosomal protein S12 methylthiotransferase RimO [Moorella mulderi DSM 14980]
MIKTAVITLGCAKNQVDSEYMLGVLDKSHFALVSDPGEAEVVIVNSCSFITAAKQEALETILGLAQGEPRPYIIVAGCLAQQHARDLWQELPEVAAFIGPGAIGRLPLIIERVLKGERLVDVPPPDKEEGELPRLTEKGRPYAYLKIAEGCDNRCSYCTIPAIKGPYRSRPLEKLVAEARTLAAAGVKELILVAQDTTAYGLDCYGEYRLPRLLRELARIPEIEWLRVLYAYPTRITPELVEVMATEAKVLPYLDLPLQHASESILRRMNRPGSLAAGVKTIERLRRAMPEITLRSTFIVGFPGEDEEDFQILLDFLGSMQFDWVGAFKYSPEAGTGAADLPDQVPEEVKEERYRKLMLYQQPITRACNERWVGRQVQVLIEGPGVGRSFRQAPEVDGLIYIKGSTMPAGTMTTVKLTRVHSNYDLMGEVETKR